MNRRVQPSSSALNRDRRRWHADTITLIPASQLAFREHWVKIVRGLPAREALVVVPEEETPLKRVARALVPQLRARGRHVTAVGAHAKAVPQTTTPAFATINLR
jgi:phosphoserine phosphatase